MISDSTTEIIIEMEPTMTTTEETTTLTVSPTTRNAATMPVVENGGGANCPFIKTSLSMTSLPPDDNQLDGTEVIKAKLRIERPYNSLKKKRNSHRDSWRHSWGSGHSHHSHSSCSLYSNTTGIGLSSGKDEFWAALQTNYNYIMDTNLMDACREARCELECETRTIVNTPECCSKMMQPSRIEGTPEDVKNLRRWLREKEDTLGKAPTLSEATHMPTQQLQKLLADHSVLYCEIVSHARVVSACVRAFEKETNSNNTTTAASAVGASSSSYARTSPDLKDRKKASSPNSGEYRTSEDNLKGLERRYHLLYLKAIEVQCLFEGLLGKRNSSSVLSRASSTDTDDEPATKVARYSDSETPKRDFSGLFDNFCHESEAISDEIISEADDESNSTDNQTKSTPRFSPRVSPRYSPPSASRRHHHHYYRHYNRHYHYPGYHHDQNGIDFDADSEGSEFDVDNGDVIKDNIRSGSVKKDPQSYRDCCNQYQNANGRQTVLSETMDSNCLSAATKKSPGPLLSETTLKTVNSFNWATNCTKTGSVAGSLTIQQGQAAAVAAVINQQNANVGTIGTATTATALTATTAATTTTAIVATGKKRHRSVDVSKFNRSNRKSKNCAIFYFKHLDTDNENFGLSSQGSDAIKSGDPSSDDEGWFYSNDCVDGKNRIDDDSDKENSTEIANISSSSENLLNTTSTSTIISTASATTVTTRSSVQTAVQTAGTVLTMEEFATARELAVSSTLLNGVAIITNEENRDRSLRSDLNHLKLEVDMKTVANVDSSSELTPVKKNRHGSSGSGSDSNITPVKFAVQSSELSRSKESIKQLVLDAENLVRDELLKTPTKSRHSVVKISSTVKKRETIMSGSNLQKVQEWLEHQPQKEEVVTVSQPNTDCEASGEYTESDSSPARDSDSSEGFTDSIATCMQTTGESNSQCTSTEKIGGSAEPIPNCGSNSSLGCAKVIRRTNKRHTDRPWSVSCLSQLTESDAISPEKMAANQGLATHSISESALHILSSPGRRVHRKDSPQTPVKTPDSKGSLKRRKPRRRKNTNKRSDSGSDGLIQKLFEQQSISSSINIIEDITEALSLIQVPQPVKREEQKTSDLESEEDSNLPKPNFKLGPVTNPSFPVASESKLGSLAALANYMHEETGDNTGTEDHSSFSEQAWDNYQEKYNSENYSEGMDSDAARRLLEFGDDYRAFLDSQSDCCSSLSAANNFDSLSPPRMDSLNAAENKLPQQPVVSNVDHIRRRRALELEYERRRELKKKNSHDELRSNRSPHGSLSSDNNSSVKSGDRLNVNANKSFAEVVRRLDFGSNSPPHNLRKTSESDTNNSSIRRRKSEDSSTIRRRISRASDKAFKIYSLASSSNNASSDDEKEIKSLLIQSRSRLENTNALKIRSHLLRPEDYDEIITTCRDNIVCLNSVLRGAPGTVLSTARTNETRDLLSSWENLMLWSENTAVARKMQEEMIIVRNALNRLGKHTCDLDSEASIQLSIEELKNEKSQLQTYRTTMLRLNAAVHSWITREELKLGRDHEVSNSSATEASNATASSSGENVTTETETDGRATTTKVYTAAQSGSEFHKQLKDEVAEMYCAWDEADTRVSNQLESLTTSLVAWRQLEFGLSEFHQVLDKDRGTLEGLEGALDRGQTNPTELAQNVKLVAKLLSEKVDASKQQVSVVSTDFTEQARQVQNTQFHTVITSSNGSLSDSGISDGGTTSDGGLSERERRLGVLRRLAKQLENALAPGSEALRSITARMESAELELKSLQNTCRELIVRTTNSQQASTKSVGTLTANSTAAIMPKLTPRSKKSPSSKRKNKRKHSNNNGAVLSMADARSSSVQETRKLQATAPDSGDPDDPKDDPLPFSDDEFGEKRGWMRRVARMALPVQLALITLFCAACFMEPRCCDTINNFSMSFTPQLRYIRGPPPI